jgi:hypothetical protein
MINYISLLGGIIILLAHLPLFRSIVRKEIHLNIATWLSWVLLDTTTLVVSLVADANFPALVFAFTICAWGVLILILKSGVWKWGPIETASLLLVLVSLFVWLTAGPAPALIALVIGTYGAAGLPTLYDAYKNPERRQALPWYFFALGGALNVVGAVYVVGTWKIIDSLFPTVAAIFNGLVGILHTRKKI